MGNKRFFLAIGLIASIVFIYDIAFDPTKPFLMRAFFLILPILLVGMYLWSAKAQS